MENEQLKLQPENIVEWKRKLDRIINELSDFQGSYSTSLSDEEWLDNYLDHTPQEAYLDEAAHWED